MQHNLSLAIGIGILLGLGTGCTDRSLPVDGGEPPAPQQPGGPPADQPPPDQPPPPPAPPGPSAIYIADTDGSNVRRLVSGERPAWSPDGTRIAFQRDGGIHVIGIDGTGETLVGKGREPGWSPEGHRLAFAGLEGIAVMGDDGSEATTILRHDFRDDTWAPSDLGAGKPAWSPAGDRIAFEHRGDGEMIPAQIFVMNADGSDLRRLTPTAGIQYAESDPSWSPDGSAVAFWSFGHGIAVVPAAGGTPHTIYKNDSAVFYGAKPVLSPDGSAILFAVNNFSLEAPAIWTIPATGGTARVLIEPGTHPAWSPDGARIAFDRRE